jgi:hypothetical protein
MHDFEGREKAAKNAELFPPFGQAIHLPHSELMCFNPEDGKCNVS